MRLKRARIQNFRCLADAEISFDSVTTFIGPGGVGKSTVLRGLDWFFNGERSLIPSEEDICHDATERRIRIEAEFDRLALWEIQEGPLHRIQPSFRAKPPTHWDAAYDLYIHT